jgi:membrane protein YqaA with SNARE-associated domain
MEEALIELGYLGLFLVAFVSATLLPAATEVVLLGMIGLGYSLGVMLIVATAGNFLGAILNYSIGRKGITYLQASRFALKPEHIQRTQGLFQRWGAPVLFFSWVPFLGDPLTIVAGLVRAPLRAFFIWVLAGRMLRYAAVLFAGDTALRWLS